MLAVAPELIASDGAALVVFQGTPYTRLTWSLVGTGSLTQVENYTDSRGVAKAVFVPSAGDQTATVSVSYAT